MRSAAQAIALVGIGGAIGYAAAVVRARPTPRARGPQRRVERRALPRGHGHASLDSQSHVRKVPR